MATAKPRKPIEWMGSTLRDLRGCSAEVRGVVGFALDHAQCGGRHLDAKRMKGDLRDVTEIVVNDEGGTYRAMYTVKFAGVVYVLHLFQKKSKSGKKTPLSELQLIRSRLKAARKHYEQHYKNSQPSAREAHEMRAARIVRGSR